MTGGFLDASLIPLEKALLARAAKLEEQEAPGHIGPGGKLAAEWLAAEFRELARELRHG